MELFTAALVAAITGYAAGIAGFGIALLAEGRLPSDWTSWGNGFGFVISTLFLLCIIFPISALLLVIAMCVHQAERYPRTRLWTTLLLLMPPALLLLLGALAPARHT